MRLLNYKRYFLLSSFIYLLGFSVKAQANMPYIDDRLFHFGFSLGVGVFDFGVTPSMEAVDNRVYTVRVSDMNPTFSVGIVSDLRLNRFFNLRFTPTLLFGERTLTYKPNDGGTNLITGISSIPICMPLFLKYSSERTKNYRPYLLWGGGAYLDLGRNKDNPVLLKTLDFYTEFGVGCDLYFTFFKLSPELKFALGFNNVLTPYDERNTGNSVDNKFYSIPLSKLTSRMLTLSFNFE